MQNFTFGNRHAIRATPYDDDGSAAVAIPEGNRGVADSNKVVDNTAAVRSNNFCRDRSADDDNNRHRLLLQMPASCIQQR